MTRTYKNQKKNYYKKKDKKLYRNFKNTYKKNKKTKGYNPNITKQLKKRLKEQW